MKRTIHDSKDMDALEKRKYKLEELQVIWDKLDEANKEISKLKKNNTTLKSELTKIKKEKKK